MYQEKKGLESESESKTSEILQLLVGSMSKEINERKIDFVL